MVQNSSESSDEESMFGSVKDVPEGMQANGFPIIDDEKHKNDNADHIMQGVKDQQE